MGMPEEINRLVTDRLSDLLLTPDEMSSQNLLDEEVPLDRVKFVGNIMIDTLEANRDKAMGLNVADIVANNLVTGVVAAPVVKNPDLVFLGFSCSSMP